MQITYNNINHIIGNTSYVVMIKFNPLPTPHKIEKKGQDLYVELQQYSISWIGL